MKTQFKFFYKIFAGLLLLGIAYSAQSQINPIAEKRQEKIEAMKIAFFTNKMALTPKESQLFWPVYNVYSEQLKEVQKNRKSTKMLHNQGIDKLSDKDLEAIMEDELKFEQASLDLRIKFHNQMKQVLSVRKMALYYQAERDFKKELLQKAINIKEQKQQNPQRGGDFR